MGLLAKPHNWYWFFFHARGAADAVDEVDVVDLWWCSWHVTHPMYCTSYIMYHDHTMYHVLWWYEISINVVCQMVDVVPLCCDNPCIS